MIHTLGLEILGECAIKSNRISVYIANTAAVLHLMWWLALKQGSVSLSAERTPIASSSPPAAMSMLSVAFCVI